MLSLYLKIEILQRKNYQHLKENISLTELRAKRVIHRMQEKREKEKRNECKAKVRINQSKQVFQNITKKNYSRVIIKLNFFKKKYNF